MERRLGLFSPTVKPSDQEPARGEEDETNDNPFGDDGELESP